MSVYNYEIAPVHSENREVRNQQVRTGTIVAKSYGSATQLASAKAAEVTKETGVEFGVVRIW